MTATTSAAPGCAASRGTETIAERWAEYRAAFERYQTRELTGPELAVWDQHRLAGVLGHVTAHSPFYREHLAGFDPAAVSPADLPALPFTTKEDLRRESHRVLSGPMSDAAIYYETTGTTGASTPCPRGPLDILTSNAHVIEAWRRVFGQVCADLDRMPVVGLLGPSELYAFGDVFGAVAQELGACHVKLWPESPRVGFAKALRLLKELRVEVIVCSPALCVSLAKAAQFHGYDLERDFAVRAFLVLGEICTPAFAANVSTLWPGARVYPALYGSQEALCLATGCVEQRLHLSRLNYLPEVIDPRTGRSLGSAGEGELCVTMLIDGIKPLIRYRTGDLVRLDMQPCGCDAPGPVVEVLGRAGDRIEIGDRGVLPVQLETAVLTGLTGCLGYQLVIDSTDGTDFVEVRVDLTARRAAETAAARIGIAERMRKLCGVPIHVHLESEIDPITTTGSFVSWKAARIQDLRNEPDAAARTAREVSPRYAVTS